MNRSTGGSKGKRDRGQSELIGVILVFGLMIVGAVVVVALGASAVGDSQDRLAEQRAEKAMTQFDSKAALVALGSSDVQQVSFGTDRASNFEVRDGEGWMRLTIDNQSAGGGPTTLVNESLGAITYEVNDNKIAYQGGGVWKKTESAGNRSVMVSPPEFHFRNGTLTLPIMNVTGEPSLGNRASLTHEKTIRKYPTAGGTEANPLDNHLVKVTVKSDYYIAWGRYFEDRTDGEVDYNHTQNTVTLTLITPVQQRKIVAASASLAASGSFTVNGAPLNQCHGKRFTDSYNSSDGTYCGQSPGDEGDLIYGQDIDISSGGGNAEYYGDVTSGASVIAGNNIDVFGNISHTTGCTDCAGAVSGGGTVNVVSGVPVASPINPWLQSRVDAIGNNNDNTIDGRINSNDRLEFGHNAPSDTVTLPAGRYYLDKIDLDDGAGRDKLVLDTTTGDVTLAVHENIELGDSTEIEVIGDNNVKILVEGVNTGPDPHFEMGKNTGVTNSDDDATQIRMYGQDNFTAIIGGSGGGNSDFAEYVGVIYAPPGNSGTGSIKLRKSAIYGGILTGTTTIPSSGRGTIHYDEELRNTQVIDPNAKVLKITYLHVSVNKIRVS